MTGFVVVIPVRMASQRLPGKALLAIEGRPMISWVWERARRSRADEVIIATDDERIQAVAAGMGAEVEMTAATHASGTDRIAEVARRRGWHPDQIVVNVQGDEPLLPPALVDQVADLLERHRDAGMATLTTPVRNREEFVDPHMVKVVTDRLGHALYFSRAPIPTSRDGDFPRDARRHVGIYAYRAATLALLAATPPCKLEETERLEQLRALWLGQRIVVADAVELPPRGVDTADDLDHIRRLAVLQLRAERPTG